MRTYIGQPDDQYRSVAPPTGVSYRCRGRESDCDQYWSAIEPVLVSNRKQYWSPREVVLVGRVTSTGWFLLLLRGCLTAPFFEDEVEGIESCGGRWLGGLLGRGALLNCSGL